MLRGPLESPSAEANKAPVADNPQPDSLDSDLCLYSAWDYHTDQLLEAAPVAEPRCYLWAGAGQDSQEQVAKGGAPPSLAPQSCVYTTTGKLTPPSSFQPATTTTNEHGRQYCTSSDTSRSSSSLSSADSNSPLNRNSGREPHVGAASGGLGDCLPHPPRIWLLATSWLRRQASAQHLKMLLKRRSLLLAGTCLILISCTIASLAFSRNISQRLLTERQVDPSHHQTPLAATLFFSNDELEFRTLELVDLIECGKTFAAIKTRLEVQVPRSTPVHHQKPSFLNHSPQTATSSHQQASASSGNEAHFMLVETKSTNQVEDPEGEDVVALGSQEHLKRVEELKAQMNSTAEAPIVPLVAQSNTPLSRMLAPIADAPDPVDEARKAMGVFNEDSYNRTLVECFFVDTEKRFDQRVALEDHYRLVASTRSVPMKLMITALIDCRHIDWRRAPAETTAGGNSEKQPATGTSQTVLIGASQQTTETPANRRQQLDLISSIVASILRDEPATGTSINRDAASPDNRRGSYSSMGLSMVSGIVPNTLWCGLGDRASNYSQLGPELRVDSCCRAHDHCPIRLRPLSGDYGLFNWSVSTRSHCDCDQDFNQCLRQVNSTLATVIRTLYFRLVGTHCIAVGSVAELST